MKKILSIACLALIVVALASCKKTYVTNVVPNQTWISSPVQVTDWALTTDGKAYAYDLKIPTHDFFNDDDATIAELSFDTGTNRTYEPMPYVYNSVSFSYTHYIGTDGFPHIIIYSQLAGSGAASKPVDPVIVKLVLIPSIVQ
ncbi:hypothetical protein [Mucilaginibacter sp. UR6-11]|uniref:hypothetical protein n=1 Tax=Mucilaginibacter sp. UR6-11 TaxID=1435644 RepID=UPI001E3A9647|nr:hypothetical protein [Mucilaginibacter sp. UR6-11]MCC8427265.1 hypothetical protein [Mucilaginibacter sp. UR6-11]